MKYVFDPSHSLGIYRLDSCSLDAAFLISIQAFFRDVQKLGLQHVAIDVRNNSGGDSRVIAEFLAYTQVKSYYGFSGTLRYSPEANAQHNYGISTGTEAFSRMKITVSSKPDIPLFTGKLYVLISNKTFSSANWMATIVQDNHLGTIIGEPTGNKPTSYGYPLSFKLPESGLPFAVSHYEWVRPNVSRSMEAALKPDVFAPTTAADIMTGIDTQVEALKKAIRQQTGS